MPVPPSITTHARQFGGVAQNFIDAELNPQLLRYGLGRGPGVTSEAIIPQAATGLFKFADRVLETTAIVGTGAVTLSGAVAGFRSFVAGIGNGNQCYYCIEDTVHNDWEVGLGTVTAGVSGGSDSLSRDSVWASTNAGALVSFSNAVKNVYCTLPEPFLNSVMNSSQSILNGSIAATVSNNALTISVKQYDGANNPSPSSPVYVAFRNSAAAPGFTIVRIITALSVTIPNGQSMGLADSTQARIWCYLVNNAGSAELAVYNAVSGTNLKRVDNDSIVSTSAVSGANAAQTLYSTTARSNVACRVIGYVEVQIGVSSAWSNSPTKVQVQQQGMPEVGDLVQNCRSASGAVATGTTQIPLDDTIPQSNEGDQYYSQAITPLSAANILKISSKLTCTMSNISNVTMALFQDNIANALGCPLYFTTPAGNYGFYLQVYYQMLAGTTSSTTFKVRAGTDANAGTLTVNGLSGARKYGGIIDSYLLVEEIMG